MRHCLAVLTPQGDGTGVGRWFDALPDIHQPLPDLRTLRTQAIEGNVGLAFALVIAAGLCTALGATLVFCTSVANQKVLAGALGASAGVMMVRTAVSCLWRQSQSSRKWLWLCPATFTAQVQIPLTAPYNADGTAGTYTIILHLSHTALKADLCSQMQGNCVGSCCTLNCGSWLVYVSNGLW